MNLGINRNVASSFRARILCIISEWMVNITEFVSVDAPITLFSNGIFSNGLILIVLVYDKAVFQILSTYGQDSILC